MYILVINAGSSSLKYQLMKKQTQEVVAKGLCEKVGMADSFHKYELGDKENLVKAVIQDHHEAVKAVLETLMDPSAGILANLDDIVAVGHRVVHGGEYFSESVVITDEVIARIEECVPLAPLHNPPALMGIKACVELMPSAVQVAVFDTAFFQTIPPRAYMYALPYEMYEKHRIRKYGFHGTSHRYVSQKAADLIGWPLEELRIVTCHLGNGCSLSAVDCGRAIDNSLGFTPLDGLMMGTRCGSIDPAIVTYMINKLDMTADEAESLMNRKSGLLGISGISNDLRDVRAAADEGNERALLAYEMYSNTVKRFIGQYVFEMGGVDAIVFAGGVGENDARMRQMILDNLENLGIELDPERNKQRGGERIISTDDSSVCVLVIPTNEELMIVKDVINLLKA
jgi:acetate kinase